MVATWHCDSSHNDASYLYEVHFWRHLTDDELVDKLKNWARKKETTEGNKTIAKAEGGPEWSIKVRSQVAQLCNFSTPTYVNNFRLRFNNLTRRLIPGKNNSKLDQLSYIEDDIWTDLLTNTLSDTSNGLPDTSNDLEEFFQLLAAIASRDTFSNKIFSQWCTKSISESKKQIRIHFEKFEKFESNSSNINFRTIKNTQILFALFAYHHFRENGKETTFRDLYGQYKKQWKKVISTIAEAEEIAVKNISELLLTDQTNGTVGAISIEDKINFRELVTRTPLDNHVMTQILSATDTYTNTPRVTSNFNDSANDYSAASTQEKGLPLLDQKIMTDAFKAVKDESKKLPQRQEQKLIGAEFASEIISTSDHKDLSALHVFGIEPGIISIRSTFISDSLSLGLSKLSSVTFHYDKLEKARTMTQNPASDTSQMYFRSEDSKPIPIETDLPCIARAYLLAKVMLCRYTVSQLHRNSSKTA